MTEEQLRQKVVAVAMDAGAPWDDATAIAERFVKTVKEDPSVDIAALTWTNVPRSLLHTLVDDIARRR